MFCLPERAAWIICSRVRSNLLKLRLQKYKVASYTISAFWYESRSWYPPCGGMNPLLALPLVPVVPVVPLVLALATPRFTASRRHRRGRTPRIILKRARVLRPLERGRLRAVFLAHDPFDLLDRFVFVLLHPFSHFAFEYPDVINSVAQ